jgi:ectoine hydroxylase-related dioxygenase (phytanoyl-CoA dioxygenase family)
MTGIEAESLLSEQVETIERDGFVLLPAVLASEETDLAGAEMAAAMAVLQRDGEAIRSRGGIVYAARNVLDWFPAAKELWRQHSLTSLLEAVLGADYGLVRALYFDKPPERSWSLPWHKDMTIAVADNRLASDQFSHPTNKAGVPHVEAPEWLLARMLTLRIHLDPVTNDNGPLEVIPGSHHDGKLQGRGAEAAGLPILTQAGDVLAIRPLVTHASGNSALETKLHRRMLHLEFAAVPLLPDAYRWHTFIAGRAQVHRAPRANAGSHIP